MARTETSRWTSQSIIKVAIVAAAVGCLGPLAFAVVRSGTEPEERTRRVATVGQVNLNSSPAASQVQAPTAQRPSASASPGTTVPGASAPTSTTLPAAVPSTTSTTLTPRGSGEPQVAVVTVVDADDGKTISLRQGQVLRVVLEGPWQFAEPTDPKVVGPEGEPTYTQGENCAPLPGSHCGSMKAEFKALKTGAATITAWRAPCSEAFRCTDEAAKYQLEVRVRT